MANFEYIEKVEAVAEEEAQKAKMENKPSVSNPEKSNYWEELLRDRYEVHKVEEFNALGKGKRSRKQVFQFCLYDVLLKSLWSLRFNDFLRMNATMMYLHTQSHLFLKVICSLKMSNDV